MRLKRREDETWKGKTGGRGGVEDKTSRLELEKQLKK